jgi:hypothetical protein
MSMEMHVFYRGKLPTKTAINRAMKELGLPLTITDATRPLEDHIGFMPMRGRGEDTGVEFDVWSDPAALREINAEGVDPSLDRTANFRWGGDMMELLSAQAVAAAVAKLTGGIVYEAEGGNLQSLDEAIGAARQTLSELTASDKAEVRGTRPADIKYYLKPLLKERTDLILRGDALIMTPVRHLLRGAYFARTGSKYHLKIKSFVFPLYGAASCYKKVAYLTTWEPYFQHLLFDVLRENVFHELGKVTDLEQYADYLDRWKKRRSMFDFTGADPVSHVTTLLLAGQREAAERVASQDLYGWTNEIKMEASSLLGVDVATLVADHHEVGRKRAALLGDAWQPTPFPVELPVSERKSARDPEFAHTPWVEWPNGSTTDPPEQVGEVKFARGYADRNDRIILITPLSRAEAQTIHDAGEGYCFFVRLARGEMVSVERSTGWSPHNPEQTRPGKRREEYILLVRRSSGSTWVRFSDWRHPETLALERILIEQSEITYEINNFFRLDPASEQHLHIDEYGSDNPFLRARKTLPLTDREMAVSRGRLVEFGEYEYLISFVENYLRAIGMG